MSKIQEALRKLRTGDDGDAAGTGAAGRTGNAIDGALGNRARSLAKSGNVENQNAVIKFDHTALREAGLLAPEIHERTLAEQYRDIKRPLIANAFGKRVGQVEDGRMIMITSAIPGEGKSFSSVNLALSISQEQDIEVLLIDADVAKPHISEVFGISKMPGLLDLLNGPPRAPESLVVPTDQDGLSILPAGRPRANATELLSGSRMESVVRELHDSHENRIMIFDTPPIMQTTESKAIAVFTGQIVLVVKADDTAQSAVLESLYILGEKKAVNLVLNQSRSISGGYQYGYQYGSYYGNRDVSKEESPETFWDEKEENKNEE